MLTISRPETRLTGKSWAQRGLLILGTSLFLVACGGGGGGGTANSLGNASTQTPAVVMLDSFAREVGASDGFGGGDSGCDGSAGDGAPIVGGKVTVTDANGKTVSATTDANGYYRVKVTGFTQPFVAKVVKPDGTTRYSLNVKPVVVNGFVTLNITGLTDKVASDVAIAGGKAGASDLTPQVVAANPTAITKSIEAIRTQFSSVITKAGLNVATFDPLTLPFVTNRTGYDNVLDNTVVTVVNGQTQLAVATVYVPPVTASPVTKPSTLVALTGTWEETGTPSVGSTAITSYTQTVPGSQVPPSLAALTDFYWVTDFVAANAAKSAQSGSNFTYSNIAITSTGFSFLVNFSSTTIGYSAVMTASYSFSNYSGCTGGCPVGSTVSMVVTGTVSGSTTYQGTTTQTPATTFTTTVKYRRTS